MASGPLPSSFTTTYHHDTYPALSPLRHDLSSRSVLITGASRGVGLAAACSFARAGCGHIALAARSPLQNQVEKVKSAAKAAGRSTEPTVVAVELDVTDESSVAGAAKRVREAFGGRLDLLVNNAGFMEEWGDLEAEGWWRSWEVNVKGTFLVTKAFLPLLLEGQGEGLRTVLCLSSVGAHFMSSGASAYRTAKFALIRLCEHLVADYADKGLLAFSTHPGGVATELASGMPKYITDQLIDTPELAGDFIAWLLAERREWLAGRYVSANWDVEELVGMKEKIVEEDLLKVRLAVQ